MFRTLNGKPVFGAKNREGSVESSSVPSSSASASECRLPGDDGEDPEQCQGEEGLHEAAPASVMDAPGYDVVVITG